MFKLYYYSSTTMEADRCELAMLTDEDFSSLGGLNQIRWAASQHGALQKLAKNYAGLATHVENVAADKRHQSPFCRISARGHYFDRSETACEKDTATT